MKWRHHYLFYRLVSNSVPWGLFCCQIFKSDEMGNFRRVIKNRYGLSVLFNVISWLPFEYFGSLDLLKRSLVISSLKAIHFIKFECMVLIFQVGHEYLSHCYLRCAFSNWSTFHYIVLAPYPKGSICITHLNCWNWADSLGKLLQHFRLYSP